MELQREELSFATNPSESVSFVALTNLPERWKHSIFWQEVWKNACLRYAKNVVLWCEKSSNNNYTRDNDKYFANLNRVVSMLSRTTVQDMMKLTNSNVLKQTLPPDLLACEDFSTACLPERVMHKQRVVQRPWTHRYFTQLKPNTHARKRYQMVSKTWSTLSYIENHGNKVAQECMFFSFRSHLIKWLDAWRRESCFVIYTRNSNKISELSNNWRLSVFRELWRNMSALLLSKLRADSDIHAFQ